MDIHAVRCNRGAPRHEGGGTQMSVDAATTAKSVPRRNRRRSTFLELRLPVVASYCIVAPPQDRRRAISSGLSPGLDLFCINRDFWWPSYHAAQANHEDATCRCSDMFLTLSIGHDLLATKTHRIHKKRRQPIIRGHRILLALHPSGFARYSVVVVTSRAIKVLCPRRAST